MIIYRYAWMAISGRHGTPTLGSAITTHSLTGKGQAKVIGSKPGFVLIKW